MQKSLSMTALFICLAALTQPVYADGKSALRAACKQDVQTYCKGIRPGGGRIVKCMKEHKSQISSTCKSAIAQAKAERKARKAGQAAPAGTSDQAAPAQ